MILRLATKKELDRHLESPGHMEKLESGLEGLEVIHSSTPKYIQVGKDIVKLSKEDSARHWTKVSMTVEGKDDEVIEDLRPQLLGEENMELTPKRVVLEDIKKYEPLQKLRVRLWPCKTGLSPPVTLCY